MGKISVRGSSGGSLKMWWSGDEKWVLSRDGQRLDVYRNGIHGRDSALHDHEFLDVRNSPAKHLAISRAALRANPAFRAKAESMSMESSRLRAASQQVLVKLRLGRRVNLTSLESAVHALEMRNGALRGELRVIRPYASNTKMRAADSALTAAENATRTARAMTEKAMTAQRISTEASTKATLIQAELTARTARATAEASAKTARQAAEAAKKATLETTDAVLRSLRAAAETAARAARAAAEVAVKTARAAAEATARATLATAKAVAAAGAAVGSALSGH